MNMYATLAVTILCSVAVGASAVDQETLCLSKFDFEYKFVSKLVALENTVAEILKSQEKISDVMMDNGREQTELQDIVDSHQAVLNTLQTMVKDTNTRFREEIQTLDEKMESFGNEMTDVVENVRYTGDGGDTYIRWGRTTCPGNGTELVYLGYAGGSHYRDTGAASNYLCLTREPLWDKYDDNEQNGGTIYGSEYEVNDRSSFQFYNKELDNQNVPCAVCHITRSSTIMIPGRNKCVDGWTLEYNGYLVGGKQTHKASSEFVCMDRDPESIPGRIGADGKLFYFSEARCGSLRCPPYVSGRELTCAVCSK